jgi:formylglycine-generating enzyme required for sulfatase activity
VIWLKGNFEGPKTAAAQTAAVAQSPGAQTAPAAAATPAPAANTGAPQATPTPEIPLDEKPDPPSGMYVFQPAEPGDPPAFEMGITEVTRGQYQEYLKATLETPPPGWSEDPARMNLPVTGLAWDKAMAYCKWLAGKHGWKADTVTLPTHAEYLRAALRAKTSKGLIATLGGQTLWKKAKLGNGNGPAEVKGSPFDELFYLASNGQVYDLIGNVAEWGREAQGEQKAVLGGDFQQTAADFNPLAQRWMPATTTSPALGFRIVHLLGQ